MTIIQPNTPTEWNNYYQLRWEVLRAPWGKPKGSEKDDLEESSFHIMVMDKNSSAGVGRIQVNDKDTAQVRYMGVSETYRGQGVGSMVMGALENLAREQACTKVILHARENALAFYKSNGYIIVEPSYLMWGTIQHYLMSKAI